MSKFAIIALSLVAGASIGSLECDGCYRDPQHDGAGAANELWTYVPGLGDRDGHCLPNCQFDVMCKYTGKLTFNNQAFPPGGGTREVFDDSGASLGVVPCPGKLKDMQVNITSACGAVGGAAPKFVAKDMAGQQTSAFIFYCTMCIGIV